MIRRGWRSGAAVRQVAQIGLDRVQRSAESGGRRSKRCRPVAEGEGAFKLDGGCDKLERTDCSRRSIDSVGELAGGGGIGLSECGHMRDELGRLFDKEIQKVTLQREIAAGLSGEMDEVERLGVVARIAHFIT